jgi:hypothetical protein
MHAAGRIAMAVRERDRRRRHLFLLDRRGSTRPAPRRAPAARAGLRRGAARARLDLALAARRDYGAVSAP